MNKTVVKEVQCEHDLFIPRVLEFYQTEDKTFSL